MYIHFIVSLFLLTIGTMGVFLSRKNLILCLMSLELILLAVNLNFIFFSLYTDDLTGQLIMFFLLIVGASESAIGLCLLIMYYKGYRFYH